ncbi:flagellar biosynthetic protein [Fictibacillus macauensis ZFHKF-1]|uniref:Flagellar biosynthetic protein n=1 Tax=Fictibacillus macauensis ZFHKF-1 TaxID=1196324 RepID=I8AI15_9BACL|nr:flagellar biosynthetic protein FliO [Fictibacillus macauensis]EIT85094.1 flagellar biosynthetic protein [Fictibacillus macauensis ZFHKF-1]
MVMIKNKLYISLLCLFIVCVGVVSPRAVIKAEAACLTVYECTDHAKEKEDKQTGALEEQSTKDLYGNGFVAMFKVIAALIFVIGLLYGVLKFLKKRSKGFKEKQGMNTLVGVGLGGNKSIQAVKVGSAVFIVGIGENITLLKEVVDPQEVEQWLLSPNRTQTTTERPHSFFGRKGKKGPSRFSVELKTRLRQINDERSSFVQKLSKEGKTHEQSTAKDQS